ncbi:acyltransferase family protein [Lachnoclostridium sp. An118]|uniref:acyltransferase family protein n=1 Tax=Lachnoclostridium sp. An118 TaxID=1965547 RepID=UPI0023B922DA|nr:acyltransferase family protein [Lachnoclostridium sp. An118]
MELFRIITMLAIVAHHYVVNSGLTATAGPIYANPLSIPSIFLLLFGAWGKIGINCFVFITGYFLCKSHVTAKKFVKLLFEVMFYRIVIYMIFYISGYTPVTLSTMVEAFLPVTAIAQNFTGTYLIFFLCIPFLNVLIHNLRETQHVYLVLLSCFIYVFFGTVKVLPVTMNYVSWYIVLYFIASYIRLYPKKIFESRVVWGWMTVASLVLAAVSVIACAWLGTVIGRNMAYFFVTDSNTFLAVLTGVSAFLFFKNIKLRYSWLINTIASTTFGVLLIHANSDAMRKWLWDDILNNVGFFDSAWLPVHAVGSVIVIFAVCSVIDLVRIKLVERPFLAWWDKHEERLSNSYKRFERKVFEKMNISIK